MRRIVASLFVAIVAHNAQATLLTLSFSGTIDSVSDPGGLLQGSVIGGSAFSGTYTFDANAPDASPLDPTLGRYSTPASSLTTWVGAFALSATAAECEISVSDKPYGDAYTVGAVSFQSAGLDISELNFHLGERTGNVFLADALPLAPPGLGSFTSRNFFLQGGPLASQFVVRGTVTALVPEPVALLLWLPGTLVIAAFRRRALALFTPLALALTNASRPVPSYAQEEPAPDARTQHVSAATWQSATDSSLGNELSDIVFVIDGSDSISDASFEMEKAGIQNRLVGANALPAAQGRVYRPDGRFRRRLRR